MKKTILAALLLCTTAGIYCCSGQGAGISQGPVRANSEPPKPSPKVSTPDKSSATVRPDSRKGNTGRPPRHESGSYPVPKTDRE